MEVSPGMLFELSSTAPSAVRCRVAISAEAARLGLRLRCGVHTGEV